MQQQFPLLLLVLFSLLLTSCGRSPTSTCVEGRDAVAVVARTDGAVLDRFDVGWGPMEPQGPRASTVEISQAGGRYLFLNVDRTGRLYDIRTGELVRDIPYPREMAADPHHDRLVETYFPLEDFTFPDGLQISGIHPTEIELRSVEPDGTVNVLHHEAFEVTAPRRVAFTFPKEAVPLPDGDLIFPQRSYEILVTTDSLGTHTYQTYYRLQWHFVRWDAETDSIRSLATAASEPYVMGIDSAATVITFGDYDGRHIADLETGEVEPIEPYVHWIVPSPDGRYLLREEADYMATVVQRSTGTMWALGGGNGRRLGNIAFGPDEFLYVARTVADSSGVWRIPLRPQSSIDDAELVWSAEPLIRELQAGTYRDLSAPLFIDDESFLILVQATNAYTGGCN